MSRTKIPWADYTINPLKAIVDGKLGWHCTKISAGCDNCYAEQMNLRKLPICGNGAPYDNRKVEWVVDLKCFDTLPKRKGGIVFLQSMGDLFHEDIEKPEILEPIFARIAGLYGRYNFVILTKRPHRIETTLRAINVVWGMSNYLQDRITNLWLGVSVEDQSQEWRIAELLKIPAAKRIVSYEPALGELILNPYLPHWCQSCSMWHTSMACWQKNTPDEKRDLKTNRLDWVIAGCESGPKRRKADINWCRAVRDQCRKAGVPIYIKQIPIGDRISKDPAEWPFDLNIREFPQ